MIFDVCLAVSRLAARGSNKYCIDDIKSDVGSNKSEVERTGTFKKCEMGNVESSQVCDNVHWQRVAICAKDKWGWAFYISFYDLPMLNCVRTWDTARCFVAYRFWKFGVLWGCEMKGMAIHQLFKLLGIRKESSRVDRDKWLNWTETGCHWMSLDVRSIRQNPCRYLNVRIEHLREPWMKKFFAKRRFSMLFCLWLCFARGSNRCPDISGELQRHQTSFVDTVALSCSIYVLSISICLIHIDTS